MKTRISQEHFLIRAKNVPWKAVRKETILVNLIDGEYYIINEIGFKIWEMSDGTEDIESISKKISKGYKVKEFTVVKDIITFAKKLSRLGLTKIKRSTPKKPADQSMFKPRPEKWQASEGFKRPYLKPKLNRIGTLKSDAVDLKYRMRLINK